MSKKKFDQETQKKALEWLDKKWPQTKRECEICGAKKWSIPTDFTTPIVFDDGLQIGGTSYPSVNLICENCGNTKYFNAVKMGLLEEKSEAIDE